METQCTLFYKHTKFAIHKKINIVRHMILIFGKNLDITLISNFIFSGFASSFNVYQNVVLTYFKTTVVTIVVVTRREADSEGRYRQ